MVFMVLHVEMVLVLFDVIGPFLYILIPELWWDFLGELWIAKALSNCIAWDNGSYTMLFS